jgi:hypothetical protein
VQRVGNLIDQTQYNIGALRDSIISLLHANILTYKLDCYIENILIPKYIVGDMHLVLAGANNKKKIPIIFKKKKKNLQKSKQKIKSQKLGLFVEAEHL